MENENPTCPIWGTTVTRIEANTLNTEFLVKGSPRAGGDYRIEELAKDDVGALDEKVKAKLTTLLIESRRAGDHRPLVTCELVEKAKRANPLPVYVRAERLLRYLASKANFIGEGINFRRLGNEEALAWAELTTPFEIAPFLDYLEEMSWLHRDKEVINSMYEITVKGHAHVAEQSTKKDLSQCFVAMWFDDSMNPAYEEGIKKAVEECGYKPLRIDLKKDVNKIDDEIIAEIRRSRFVVADFTHDEKGDRGAVYYEAGFAYGLGLEVIYSCRKAPKNELNFDTRQYHHILWETPEDLRKQLRDRIRARVGDYKAEPAPAVSE